MLSPEIDFTLQVCGTDLHAFLARTPKFPTATEPDPITGETLPVTLGHEYVPTSSEKEFRGFILYQIFRHHRRAWSRR